MTGPIHRRRLLSLGGGLSILGAVAPFAAQLAAAGSAAGQTSEPDYRALVCIFLYGGNDSHNTIIETEEHSFARYSSARGRAPTTDKDELEFAEQNAIALLPKGTEKSPLASAPLLRRLGGVLPLTLIAPPTPLALHPSLAPLLPIFGGGRLAIVANVGTLDRPLTKLDLNANPSRYPKNLFSHNDQQSTWQAGASEGARVGWGGRLGDLLVGMNGQEREFTAMSTAGNAVFLSGRDVIQYQMNPEGQPAISINGTSGMLFGSAAPTASVRAILKDNPALSVFGDDLRAVTDRSMMKAATLNNWFETGPVVSEPSPFMNPITEKVARNPVSEQLRTIARMIAVGKDKGLKRQVFFVGVGGWDSHDHQNVAQTLNLARLAHGMAYFDTVLSSLGGSNMQAKVTTFTASDFSRSFTSNGDGTDHAWGGHHFVMGGSVDGNKVYGKFPTLGIDSATFKNPDMIGGVLVPTTSVDQYAATLGRWLGASESNLNDIFPNLRNFTSSNLGFMNPL